MKKKLQDKVIVVTGATSGVGRAMVRAFAEQGARIGLVARGIDGLVATAQEVDDAGGKSMILPLDVADADAVMAAADAVVDAWGRIDVWVNDAMVSVFSRIADMKPEEYRRVVEVDYLGYVHGTLAALKHMRPRNRGTILQIGSALAYRSIPLQSAYCASKAAVRGFTDSLRSELVREGSAIHVVMLQLPAVNTPQFEVVRNRLPQHAQPVPPIYEPEVVARAALRAIQRPRREVWVGWSAARAILGQRLMPGPLDRYLAKAAWETQETEDLPVGHPRHHRVDNVDGPLTGDRGAHGPFDDRARKWTVPQWIRAHRALLWSAVAVGIAAVAVAMRPRSASLEIPCAP